MKVIRIILSALVVLVTTTLDAQGQTSSLGEQRRRATVGKVPKVAPREEPEIVRNQTYDRYSWIATKTQQPKTFRVGDLITIIVRERRTFEADAELETKKKFDLTSELDAFIKLTDKGIGSANFRRGKPNIDYKLEQKLRSEGDAKREDQLTTRVTGKILDVKPNGVLVLEAQARVKHDDEVSVITFTGNCRKQDVTPDNTVLSTQVAQKNIVVSTEGALKRSTTRGWLVKMFDSISPF